MRTHYYFWNHESYSLFDRDRWISRSRSSLDLLTKWYRDRRSKDRQSLMPWVHAYNKAKMISVRNDLYYVLYFQICLCTSCSNFRPYIILNTACFSFYSFKNCASYSKAFCINTRMYLIINGINQNSLKLISSCGIYRIQIFIFFLFF